jgi:hypothetical protein
MVRKAGKLQRISYSNFNWCWNVIPSAHIFCLRLLIFTYYGSAIETKVFIGYSSHYTEAKCTNFHKLGQKHRTMTFVKLPNHVYFLLIIYNYAKPKLTWLLWSIFAYYRVIKKRLTRPPRVYIFKKFYFSQRAWDMKKY